MIMIQKRISAFIPIIICLIWLSSCSPYRIGNSDKYQNRLVPPNCIKIADNYFVDRSDIKNMDYQEFMFWTERIFGGESKEFLSVLPDSLKKIVPDSTYTDMLAKYYYNYEPGKNINSLGGINPQQFQEYTRWRTDRVYEMILCRFSIIDFDTAQSAHRYFSIDNFFDGSYLGVKPDTVLPYIPAYRVPTAEEASLISQSKAFISKTNSQWSGYRNVCQWIKIGSGLNENKNSRIQHSTLKRFDSA